MTMLHTIQLTDSAEEALRQIAKQGGQTPEAVLAALAETLLGSSRGIDVRFDGGTLRFDSIEGTITPVRTTPDVMGGDACIRNTRIAVWQLVQLKRSGCPEERILANYPGLTAADLTAAWDFYAGHAAQIEAELSAHEDAA